MDRDNIPFPNVDLAPAQVGMEILYKVIDVGLAAGRLVTRHLMWQPRPSASDHFIPTDTQPPIE